MPIDTNMYGPPTPTPSGGGGILGDLASAAPTALSLGGGIVGSIFGGPLGGIAGAAAGGGIGQGLEDASRGQSPLQVNDLTTAGTSAIGQGLGEGVGAVLGKIGGSGAVASTADNLTAKFLKQQLDAHVLPSGINPDDVVQTMMDNGITDLRKVPGEFGKLTGKMGMNGSEDAGGLYTDVMNNHINAMERAGTTVTGNYNTDTAANAASGKLASNFPSDSSKNEAVKYMNGQLEEAGLLKKSYGFGTDAAGRSTNASGGSPARVNQVIKNLQGAAREQPYEGAGKATGEAYYKLAQQLKGDLDNHPAMQSSPLEIDDMKAEIDNIIGKTNPKMAAAQKAKLDTIAPGKGLREIQKPLVDAIRAAQSKVSKGSDSVSLGKLAHLAEAAAGGAAVGHVPGAVLASAADLAGSTPAGGAALASGAQALPGALSSLGSKAGMGTLGAISNVPGSVAGAALASAGQAGKAMNSFARTRS